MSHRLEAANDAPLAELSRQGLASAAARLQVDPVLLARGLGEDRAAATPLARRG